MLKIKEKGLLFTSNPFKFSNLNVVSTLGLNGVEPAYRRFDAAASIPVGKANSDEFFWIDF